MGRFDKEFNFNDDIELINLTHKMNTGNFIDYTEDEYKLNEKEENIKQKEEKFNL